MTQKTRDNDVAFIQALAELLRENDLTELEVKREYGEADRLNVRVSRGAHDQRRSGGRTGPGGRRVPATAAADPRSRRQRQRQPPPRPRPRPTATRPRIPAPSPRRWSARSICNPNPARRPS